MDFDVRGKKITIMGLGLLGRGIGDVRFLAEQGAHVLVTDKKPKEALAPALKELRGTKNVSYVLGRHRKSDFTNADIVLKAAGVPLDSEYILAAQKAHVPVKMDDSWFAQYCPVPIIGITGTRGKTTTSYMISELAKRVFPKVHLAGNIKGIATLPLLPKIRKNHGVVLELSSWQLQGWHDEKLSPHIAVVTNIFRDHLNYYDGDMRRYIQDKKAIFTYQTKDDYLILNRDNPYSKTFAKEAQSQVIWFSASDIPKSWELKIPGMHNRENAAAALSVGKLLGLSAMQIKEVLLSFTGVEDRLEYVATKKGVAYYNDTTATEPNAVIAALRSFKKPIVLIAGGVDKSGGYLTKGDLPAEIKKRTKSVVLFEGVGGHALEEKLKQLKYSGSMIMTNSMHKAVEKAALQAESGDIVLLSPGGASFELFKNEYDRGDQFKKAVKKLK